MAGPEIWGLKSKPMIADSGMARPHSLDRLWYNRRHHCRIGTRRPLAVHSGNRWTCEVSMRFLAVEPRWTKYWHSTKAAQREAGSAGRRSQRRGAWFRALGRKTPTMPYVSIFTG